jgi:hypothetical protein
MNSGMSILALAAIAMCLPAHAEEAQAQSKDVTLQEYTDALLETFGGDATVVTGEINGYVKGNYMQPFTDYWPLPSGVTPENRLEKSITIQATPTMHPCTSAPFAVTPHPILSTVYYRWCKIPVVANHEAKRETWVVQLGGDRRTRMSDFDCQNGDDKNEMLRWPILVYAPACLLP